MLRMRLSLDCGCVSAATQGRPDNGVTVEITRIAQDHKWLRFARSLKLPPPIRPELS
jgi:hypothetical protein